LRSTAKHGTTILQFAAQSGSEECFAAVLAAAMEELGTEEVGGFVLKISQMSSSTSAECLKCSRRSKSCTCREIFLHVLSFWCPNPGSGDDDEVFKEGHWKYPALGG